MLLVAQQDVLKEWALTREEGAGDLETLRVPIFTLVLAFLLDRVLVVLASRVQQEPHLRAHAEVAHSEDAQFLEEGVARKLGLVARLLQEVGLHGDRADLHDVPNVQVLNPLVLIQKAQH